jgi:hypothetical protein
VWGGEIALIVTLAVDGATRPLDVEIWEQGEGGLGARGEGAHI